MHENIEAMLHEKCEDLYLKVKQRSEELLLPVNVGDNIVGFGLILNFYMFWINAIEGSVVFNVRKRFVRARRDNIIRMEFTHENEDAIIEAIDCIYNSYLEAKSSGDIEQEKQKTEERIARRAERKANREQSGEIVLLWNDVTVSVIERAEAKRESIVDESNIEKYKACGLCIVEQADKILQVIESIMNGRYSRKIAVCRKYVESDGTTLAAVGESYEVSRERIRQIVNGVDRCIFTYFKRAIRWNNAEIKDGLERLAAAFESIEYDVRSLMTYGMSEVSERKKRFIFNMLFGKELSRNLVQESKELGEQIEMHEKLAKKEQKELEAWEFYRSKIKYPSPITVNSDVVISSYETEDDYVCNARLVGRMKKFATVVEVIENPDIVFYATRVTDHRPHLLLRLADKTSVLVLALPVTNMAFSYNIKKANALHMFCKQYGYGYMIIDPYRGTSIYDIKEKEVDGELVDLLNSALDKQGMIMWETVKQIKQTHTVSNEDIAAYVLQNKLNFTLKPFCIKRWQN